MPAGELAPDFQAFVEAVGDGRNRLDLLVEGVHCGGCVRRIEGALAELPQVTSARVNLSTRRLNVTWDGAPELARNLVAAVEDLGFKAAPYLRREVESRDRRDQAELLRAMAVAGFAAANVMLISVSVWAGYVEGMGAATRDLLHWFSALIALPAIVYAGRPFYRSALAALAARRTNMDVPISLAVLLAGGMSLFETLEGGRYVYFDSAVALLFFLLLGRYLDCRARGRARAAVERLLALTASSVTVVQADGRSRVTTPDRLRPGMTLLAAMRSPVFAGTLNLGAPLTVAVTAVGEGTLLAEIVRLMENAEQRRARYVALADRISRVYAPA
ncbi:MAG: heavy metal translocating P-type ATPase, partial [Kiloniellales bacterium]|nr:heavy metal translocating P-type ATPase [Kiloniellales bacterium]